MFCTFLFFLLFVIRLHEIEFRLLFCWQLYSIEWPHLFARVPKCPGNQFSRWNLFWRTIQNWNLSLHTKQIVISLKSFTCNKASVLQRLLIYLDRLFCFNLSIHWKGCSVCKLNLMMNKERKSVWKRIRAEKTCSSFQH